MSKLFTVHQVVTMIFGSIGDASGVVLAFHLDGFLMLAILAVVVIHLSVTILKFFYDKRKPSGKRVVGFQPPHIHKNGIKHHH